ncbi:hypothetical protein SAY87_010824 [Trapa incisa]|uniref:Uncharacterized protein n=1 Tax=Trapa incisa TaxID=236973 RepID=A0AAN7GR10_9MYRT|nr:hypothetical protein SAY87_010824 [Trapa incisa]
MSVERSFEAWEEVQRHGQDLADRLAQGFTGLIQSHMAPPSFSWPNPPSPKFFDIEFPAQSFVKADFKLATEKLYPPGINDGVSAIFDIGNRLGQVGVDFGNCLNGFLQHFFRGFHAPFRHNESTIASIPVDFGVKRENNMGVRLSEDVGAMSERLREFGFVGSEDGVEGSGEEEVSELNLKAAGPLGRPKGVVNMTSTYDSRTRDVESSLVARGDLWRIEASQGSSTSGSDNSSLFLFQLGPVLFVRDSTLLLPVHLSKQHLLWYGYDRKNGMHSLCPAVWSKHRRWLLMSMLCLNPLACSFVDLQFPNGQITYVSGEGLTTSAFVPICGGLLQAEGQYPGEMRFSFSCKNKWGARITPMLQWPDKSFSLGLQQSLAWQRSGIMLKPALQLSVCPTFGGSTPGVHAELIHYIKEDLNLICGCAFMAHPSAFASVAIGRSKWNGNVGSSGVVLRMDTPLCSVGRPSFSVQINSGIEF